jgi:endoglucanase
VGGQSWNSVWGANLTGVQNRPVVLPVPHKLIYSPHEFGTVGANNPPWLIDPNFPDFMPDIWSTAWGYIATQNIAPIWIGEFGANFETPNDIDTQWITALNGYILDNNLSWAYWALPPGGTPTGILEAYDWFTLIQAKLNAIAPILA